MLWIGAIKAQGHIDHLHDCLSHTLAAGPVHLLLGYRHLHPEPVPLPTPGRVHLPGPVGSHLPMLSGQFFTPGWVDPFPDHHKGMRGADCYCFFMDSKFCFHFVYATNLRAIRVALEASGAKASAPIDMANSSVTGAPPTITFTWSRNPAALSAAIVAPILFMVVVNSADIPIMLAPSWAASTNDSRVYIHAQIDDLKTSPFQHHRNQVLANIMQVALYGADSDFSCCFAL